MYFETLGSGVIEISLFIRAIFYSMFYAVLGIELLRHREQLSTLALALAWIAIILSVFNVLMAIEWLFLLIIEGVPVA